MSEKPPGLENEEKTHQEEIPFARFHREMAELISLAMSTYEKPEYTEQVNAARDLFFMVRPGEKLNPGAIKPIDQFNFNLWFLCDYPPQDQGESYLHLFLESGIAQSLAKWEQEALQQVANSHLSLYNLVDLDPKDGTVTLRELFSVKSYKLADPRLSSLADSPYFFALRIINFGNKTRSVGDIYVYPEEMKEQFLLILQQRLVAPGAIVPPTLREMLKKKGFIFNHLQMAVRNTDNYVTADKNAQPEEEQPPAPSPENKKQKERHRVSRSVAHFMLNDYEGAKSVLDAHKSLKFDREADGGLHYKWFRQKADLAENQDLGTVVLRKRKIIFSTTGLDNLEAGKSDLQKALKPHANHMYDELEKRRMAN